MLILASQDTSVVKASRYALEVNGGEVTDYLDRDSMIKALKFATVVLQLIIDYKEEERNA